MLLEIVKEVYKYTQSNSKESWIFILGVFLAYHLILYPFFLSPLRDVPGPYLHRISSLSSLNKQRKGRWTMTVYELHKRYGDVVVLSPTEVSVNGNSKYVHDIYIKNFPKAKFYENFRNHGFKDNMFASLENDRHIAYKKLIMNLYSKSAIFNKKNGTHSIIVQKVGQLVDEIRQSSVTGQRPDYINAKSVHNEHGKGHKTQDGKWLNKSGKTQNLGIEVYTLFASLAMDVVSAFELGMSNGTDLLLHPEKRHIIISHRQVASMVFWTTLMPRFWNWAASSTILKASYDITKWQLGLYAQAEENVPDVKEDENKSTLETLKQKGLKGEYAYSFLTDNIFAGHETTAIQLAYMCYELSRPKNLHLQESLRKELIREFGHPKSEKDIIDDMSKVDVLPYLNSVLDENSRVHASIPGSEPRLVDSPYKVEVGEGKVVELPKGTGISCVVYALHRQSDVFAEPDQFIPERWLQYENEPDEVFRQRIKRMQRYMMPFGKGIRMCLGMNLALIEMKMAIANLYWHYNSKICSDWCEITEYTEDSKKLNPILMGETRKGENRTDEEKMTMYDSYTTRPLNDECWLEWYDNQFEN
ncbi:hypothetical protein G9P44_002370 [Scheffersomyces stipitis]|nr:hypothetical protein G9P44_002370 [Scheffersomyces stipitis]